MRTVSITTETQLKALGARLFHNCLVARDPVPAADKIRELHLNVDVNHDGDDFLDDARWLEAVAALIRLTPQLRTYKLEVMFVTQLELLCLMSIPTLTKLEVAIAANDHHVFPVINALSCLASLLIYNIEKPPWTHPLSHALNMPTVTDFLWNCTDFDSEEMAEFLGRCRFGAGLYVELAMPMLGQSRAPPLRPFFAQNTIKSLIISLPPETSPSLAFEIAKLPYVEFATFLPSTLPPDLTTIPGTVTIPYDGESGDLTGNMFWDFLDELLSFGTRKAIGTTVLHIWLPVLEKDFEWTSGPVPDDDHVQFIARLVPLARAMHRCGLIVKDGHGRDVSCLD
jgi:hypothetical protein